MIFSIQRFLEDHFAARGLNDPDLYAVSLANLYDRTRASASKDDFLRAMRRVRTGFFRVNHQNRSEFEKQLLSALDQRFKKKRSNRDPRTPFFGRSPKASSRNAAYYDEQGDAP